MVDEPGAFRVESGGHVDLNDLPTGVKPFYTSHKDYKKQLKKHVKKLSARQRLHYASDHWSLLIIFQGMDAAGKDGAIRHVMSGVNPQGCQVFSFKQPTDEELEHDFLWRTTRCWGVSRILDSFSLLRGSVHARAASKVQPAVQG